MAPAQRTKTFKAIFDAPNLSDIVAGTVVAFQLLFMRVQSKYGAVQGPQRQRTLMAEDQVHLEPLTDRRNIRGYDYDMPHDLYQSQSQYGAEYNSPPMPPPVREGYSRGDSLETQPLQQTRSMM